MTTHDSLNKLTAQYNRLSNLYAFAMQFFAETGKIEKRKRRGQDRERLEKIRQSAAYSAAYSEEFPLISVIIPTYSRSKVVIDRTIPSILAQTYTNWEIIIVGDRMPEAEAAELSSINHPRIRFINLKQRGRYPSEKAPLWYVAGIKPMNFGLRIAKGHWIAHLDDDDEFMPEHLAQLLDKARSTKAEWAHAKVSFIADDGLTEVAVIGEPVPRSGGISRISSLYHGSLKTFRYNQSCWKYYQPGDWDLWERFLEMGVKHVHLPRVTAIHNGSLDRVAGLLAEEQPTDPLEQGIADYQQKKYPEAIENLSQALARDPENLLAHVYLAFVCAHQGLTEEADAFITQAYAIDPTRHDLLAALGETYLQAGHPGAAQKYLEAALRKQPDLFIAYPAMAEALRRNGESERAIQLLSSAAGISSAAQENILTGLIEMLTQRGDIATLAETCIRSRNSQALHSLGIRLLIRAGSSNERIDEELAWHGEKFLPRPAALRHGQKKDGAKELRIAFLISDFAREAEQGRLLALLLHLPPAAFRTIVIDNDASPKRDETIERASLLADEWVHVHNLDEQATCTQISGLQADILIDFDSHGPRQRLVSFYASDVPFKATWSDIPPKNAAGIHWLRGDALVTEATPPDASLVTLPGLGETWVLPTMPVAKKPLPTTFGCLTAAILIGSETWQFYAELLGSLPGSTLRINLDSLGAPAREFISGIFSAAGVTPERLEFVHASSPAALCAEWQSIAVGLAPLHGPGDLALPTCLWMDTPLLALRSAAPWSQRPAALLATAGQPGLIADSKEAYFAQASQLATSEQSFVFRQRLMGTDLTEPAKFAEEFADRISLAYFKGLQ